MGISPFSSADLFIRVLLGLRLFYQEIYIYIDIDIQMDIDIDICIYTQYIRN